MGYHPKYPRGTSLRLRNSLSPWDKGPKAKIRMLTLLCLIIFPDWGLEIILNPVNIIDHPMPKQNKRKGKRRIFTFGPKKRGERWKMLGVG